MGQGRVIRVSQAQARMGGSAAKVLLRHSTQDYWQMRCDSAVCLSQEKVDKEPELHVNSNWIGMGRNSSREIKSTHNGWIHCDSASIPYSHQKKCCDSVSVGV